MKLQIDFFIHPVPLLAVAIMAVNDHWLKAAYPSWWTGKLSDFMGIFYLPVFILALVCVTYQLAGRSDALARTMTHTKFWMAVLTTDFLLILVKLSAPAARWIEALFAEHLFHIQLIQDPTDLMALSMNLLTYLYLEKYLNSTRRQSV